MAMDAETDNPRAFQLGQITGINVIIYATSRVFGMEKQRRKKMLKKTALLALGFALMAGVAFAAPVTRNTTTTEDCFTSHYSPSQNQNLYSGSENSRIQVEPAGTPDGKDWLTYAWFKFNTTGVKNSFDTAFGVGNWVVTGVKVNAYSWPVSWNIPGAISAGYNSNSTWTESTITWNNQPTNSVMLDTTTCLGDNSWSTWNLNYDPLFNDILAGRNVSVMMQNAPGSMAQICFDSKSYAGGAYGAYLSITADAAPVVPEPGSLLAMGSGLVGLLGFVSRKRLG
jgi:hypothetical protein